MIAKAKKITEIDDAMLNCGVPPIALSTAPTREDIPPSDLSDRGYSMMPVFTMIPRKNVERIAGMSIGIVTRKKVRNLLAPVDNDASSSIGSMCGKCRRENQVCGGNHAYACCVDESTPSVDVEN